MDTPRDIQLRELLAIIGEKEVLRLQLAHENAALRARLEEFEQAESDEPAREGA